MVSLIVWWPVLVAALLVILPGIPDRTARWVFVGATAVDLALVLGVWVGFDSSASGELAFEEQAPWIPGVDSSYHVGVDGLSLPLMVLTAVVFLACAVYVWGDPDRPKIRAALFLFLQTACLGTFAAADLILFFVFFDLSIVGMYFVIAGWGHGDAPRSAMTFFLYTFLGSLALLLGFIGLYVAAEPRTFDMVALAADPPLQDEPVVGVLVLAAILLGLAIKTPTVPFHTWLPPAHTDAPAAGSAVLAGVLLKLGTYGLLRIAIPMLPEAWRAAAWVIISVGVVSVLYGALLALAQTDVKRMIAYTSINHMGYVVLGLGAIGLVGTDASVRAVAASGATYQMISHGLITTALFLLAGVLWDRRGSYDLHGYGGLAAPAPKLAALFVLAAFASLGLPGFSGFIAEFQIFTGSIAAAPVTAVALLGILLTAALFLRAFQLLFTGPVSGSSDHFSDLRRPELLAVGGLMLCAVLLGVVPRVVLDLVDPAMDVIVSAVAR